MPKNAKQNTGAALTDPTYHALVGDLLTNPEQVEATSGILADWLDDHSEPKLADWHRRQLAGTSPPGTPAYAADLRRVKHLLAPLPPAVLRNLSIAPFTAGELTSSLASGGTIPDLVATFGDNEPHAPVAVVRNGFVTDLAVAPEVWVAHGPAICRANPVRTVRALRQPVASNSGEFGWQRRGLEQFFHLLATPRSVYVLDGRLTLLYPNATAAHRALSTALVEWARSQAGLPVTPARSDDRRGYDERCRRNLAAWLAALPIQVARAIRVAVAGLVLPEFLDVYHDEQRETGTGWRAQQQRQRETTLTAAWRDAVPDALARHVYQGEN